MKISRFSSENANAVLKFCPNLKNLEVECNEFPDQNYPTVEKVKFMGYWNMPMNKLVKFLQMNPQIKKFEVESDNPEKCMSEAISNG